MDMAIPYERTGRTHQKARTRDALILATRRLLEQGHAPTVEQAAAAASISRTTAYRYFPDQRALLGAAHPEIDASSLLGEDAPDGVEERFAIVVESFLRLTVATEAAQRATLRLSLAHDAGDREALPLRKGRAIGWLGEALDPVRGQVDEAALRRLVLAVRAGCGIEALVWLTDVAELSREEAVEVMRWSAGALLQAALAPRGSAPSSP